MRVVTDDVTEKTTATKQPFHRGQLPRPGPAQDNDEQEWLQGGHPWPLLLGPRLRRIRIDGDNSAYDGFASNISNWAIP